MRTFSARGVLGVGHVWLFILLGSPAQGPLLPQAGAFTHTPSCLDVRGSIMCRAIIFGHLFFCV